MITQYIKQLALSKVNCEPHYVSSEPLSQTRVRLAPVVQALTRRYRSKCYHPTPKHPNITFCHRKFSFGTIRAHHAITYSSYVSHSYYEQWG